MHFKEDDHWCVGFWKDDNQYFTTCYDFMNNITGEFHNGKYYKEPRKSSKDDWPTDHINIDEKEDVNK